MPKFGIFLAGLLAIGPMTTGALAGVGATGCDDLGAIPTTPSVDFEAQIQPVLDGCANCHGEFGPAGLDLRADESYDNLVGVISTTNPSRLRVEPFNPEASTLFLAIGCDSPGGPAFRMPGTDPQQRALVRDWIAQGAPSEPPGPSDAYPVPVLGLGSAVLLASLLLLSGLMLALGSGCRRF